MSKFTKKIEWYIRKEDDYFTTSELTWEVGKIGSGLFVVVPINEKFDVSIPFWLTWLFDPHNPKYLKAAALHDYLLKQGWDRVSAAAAFADALRVSNVDSVERLIMTMGVIIKNWS